MRLKKAQGLSMNIVIVAVIAIIVLIVIVAIFSGKARQFGKGAQNVSAGFENKCKVPGVFGRECRSVSSCEEAGGMVVGESGYDDCPDSSTNTGPACCQL